MIFCSFIQCYERRHNYTYESIVKGKMNFEWNCVKNYRKVNRLKLENWLFRRHSTSSTKNLLSPGTNVETLKQNFIKIPKNILIELKTDNLYGDYRSFDLESSIQTSLVAYTRNVIISILSQTSFISLWKNLTMHSINMHYCILM